MVLRKILGGGYSADRYADYKKNAKFLNGVNKYDSNGNAVKWSDAHPTQYYTPAASSSSYTAPKYEDYVSAPAFSQAPTAPTFAAAPTAPTLSAAPRAKANTEQFSSKWSDELQAMYDQIANRPKFSYDQNSDPLYQQYAEMYRKNAQLAMDDTVARAASLTGGYGNSYAETAGQAMYNQQMDNLNQRALDLYYAALDTYDRENQNLYQKFNLAGKMYDTDYAAYRDRIADSQWAQNYDFNAWQADNANAQWKVGYDFDTWQANNENRKWQTEYDYNRYINDRNFGYDQFINDRNYNYQLGRDAVADARYADETAYSRYRDSVGDARYADETAYARYRDSVGDARYADETAYARQQADLDRALQYYQAGYDPATGGMSAEARQQYNTNLRAQGIDPATGNMTTEAMLKYLQANGTNENIDSYIDSLSGYSKAQKDQMKAQFHNNTASKTDASLIKGDTHRVQQIIAQNQQVALPYSGNIANAPTAFSGVTPKSEFKGDTLYFENKNGEMEAHKYTQNQYKKYFEDYVEHYLPDDLTDDEIAVLYSYFAN